MTLHKLAKTMKEEMKYSDKRATLKELKILIECYKKGEYQEVWQTKLYNDYGAEYCHYLQYLTYNYKRLGIEREW